MEKEGKSRYSKDCGAVSVQEGLQKSGARGTAAVGSQVFRPFSPLITSASRSDSSTAPGLSQPLGCQRETIVAVIPPVEIYHLYVVLVTASCISLALEQMK